MFLKGENRPMFERRLLDNIAAAVPEECGRVGTSPRPGVVVLHPERATDVLAARMRDVFGVATVQPALSVPKRLDLITDAALGELRARFGDPGDTSRTFAVRAHRRDKSFPMTSPQLAVHLGAQVQAATGWSVDLSDPEVTLIVEIDHREAFVSVQRLTGAGGLPVGASGRAVVLLSGGFDSPVAAHRAMRRGLSCDFVHVTGAPYTGPSSAYKAYAVVRRLSRHQPRTRLWVAPLGRAQRALASSTEQDLRTVAQRRLMLRLAEEIAGRVGADALVTGDSLGQVASQTLSNIAAVDAACRLPVLRPLLGWDKEEIIAEARRLGTAEISELADEDCCTLLAPRRPATRSTPQALARIERRVGAEDLVENVLAEAEEFTFPATEGGDHASTARLRTAS